MMYGDYGIFSWIGMILGLVVTIAVIVGLVLLVVWAVRRTNGNSWPIPLFYEGTFCQSFGTGFLGALTW